MVSLRSARWGTWCGAATTDHFTLTTPRTQWRARLDELWEQYAHVVGFSAASAAAAAGAHDAHGDARGGHDAASTATAAGSRRQDPKSADGWYTSPYSREALSGSVPRHMTVADMATRAASDVMAAAQASASSSASSSSSSGRMPRSGTDQGAAASPAAAAALASAAATAAAAAASSSSSWPSLSLSSAMDHLASMTAAMQMNGAGTADAPPMAPKFQAPEFWMSVATNLWDEGC
ncbi:hypothetical protein CAUPRSCDRAFT_12832 [Caulochytrium protostelioides]|uniref:Uncharacterized protein n=1 Tax=Caulochytrium protostelioides TaxID=1555241 RepID=A0A4P9WW92_9FUNG|nr:hypothetical protein CAUPRSCDRAFT_12832 [Caulochytrium protostelioides]